MSGREDARPEMQQHDDAEHGQAHRGENASALCQPPHRYDHADKSILRSVMTRYGGDFCAVEGGGPSAVAVTLPEAGLLR